VSRGKGSSPEDKGLPLLSSHARSTALCVADLISSSGFAGSVSCTKHLSRVNAALGRCEARRCAVAASFVGRALETIPCPHTGPIKGSGCSSPWGALQLVPGSGEGQHTSKPVLSYRQSMLCWVEHGGGVESIALAARKRSMLRWRVEAQTIGLCIPAARCWLFRCGSSWASSSPPPAPKVNPGRTWSGRTPVLV
jgi:hypothetical protein